MIHILTTCTVYKLVREKLSTFSALSHFNHCP